MTEKFSIIIPTLNAGESLHQTLASVRESFDRAEVIVVDGGSQDETVHRAYKENVKVVFSQAGRGQQMCEGVKAALGDILVFLHADTKLPLKGEECLKEFFANEDHKIGTFGMKFDHNHWLLKMYSGFTKMDSLWTRFGDQCIVVRRNFYNELGGFPKWPLFEDVSFLQKARLRTKIYSFSLFVTTSAQRFIQNGLFRQQAKNAWLLLQYLMGVSPESLYRRYYPQCV